MDTTACVKNRLDPNQLRREMRAVAIDAVPAAKTLESAQRECILRALHDARWVIAGPGGAAATLGVKRTSLQYKMRKLGIRRPS